MAPSILGVLFTGATKIIAVPPHDARAVTAEGDQRRTDDPAIFFLRDFIFKKTLFEKLQY